MDCVYTGTINGKEVTFNSIKELDAFLAKHIDELNILHADFTLSSVNPTDVTKAKIDGISKQVSDLSIEYVHINEDGDSERILKIPNSIGVTKVLQTMGDPSDISQPLITPFDKQAYFEHIRNNLKENMSDYQIDEYIKMLENNWKTITDLGIEIHKIFQSILTNTEYNSSLPESVVNNVTKGLNNLIDWIHERHGYNCQILSEVPLVSKEINEAYARAGITSINGVADLIVIDESGVAHIYDFKASPKEVGSWDNMQNSKFRSNEFHSTKKQTASYQLAFYRSILKQYGVQVGTCSIIPVKMDLNYDDQKISGINNATINISFLDSRIDENGIFRSTFRSNHRNVAEEIFPVASMLDSIDLIESIHEPMSKFVPNYELTSQVQNKEVTIDRYKEDPTHCALIREGDADFGKGKWRIKRNGKIIYCKSDEERDRELEKIVTQENDNRGKEMLHLAEDIRAIQEGNMSATDLANDNQYKSDYCKRIFRKYLSNGWELQLNKDFIAAGIFVFTKNGICEIISLTYAPTHEMLNLGLGTSLMGATHSNYQIDEHKTIAATNGNIDLIKVMCLLNSNPDQFGQYKITKMASHNIWLQTGTETYLETLFDNFEQLTSEHHIPLNVHRSNFASTLESSVITVRELCSDRLANTINGWDITFDINDVFAGTEFLLEKLRELRNLPDAGDLRDAISENKPWNFDDPLQLSYMLLSRALNKLSNYNVYIEKDPPKWVGFSWKEKAIYTGINVNSPGTSPSLNIQTISDIMATANTHIRRRELKYYKRYKKAIADLYTYNSRNMLIGGEVRYFDNLFTKDSNGSIDKSFTLRNPNDPELAPEEAKFIEVFLEIINELKYNGDASKIKQAKNDGTYYEVPITLGETSTQIYNNSFMTALKTRYNEAVNWLRLLPEQEKYLTEARKNNKVYNKYDITALSRKNIIATHGISGFETQLENVLLDVIHTYAVNDVIKEYIPRMQGIKIALQYNQAMFGISTETTADFINRYLDVNIYSTPIMDPQLHTVYKALSAVKQITTATTLGFNYRSGLRELMQGMWIHISRSMAEAYGRNQFTKSEIGQAWKIIFKECIKNPNMLTLVDALNVEYGMSNADPYQVKDRLSQSKTGIMNFDSDALYICNRAPDIYHRMGIMIAKMLHDGCWEAHSIIDDELVYDFTKDARFNLLIDNSADKNSKEYKEQKALYNAMRQQFIREGIQINDGEPLPRAYTIQEATSIKSFSELCFGHYDQSTQMLAKSMFYGALWLHFKTYLSSKLEQWILKPGTYNQGHYNFVTNSEGIRYVNIYTEVDGQVSVRRDLETSLTEGDVWEYVQEWQGRFMEGIAYSMIDFGKALFTMNWSQWQKLWANDVKRANFKLFIRDMLWASIMMWIIKAVFLDNDDVELNPISYTLSNALYNSYADGPIHNVLGSTFNSFNPPMVNIIQDYFTNFSELMSGDSSLFEAATNSFGVLKSFKYLGYQI